MSSIGVDDNGLLGYCFDFAPTAFTNVWCILDAASPYTMMALVPWHMEARWATSGRAPRIGSVEIVFTANNELPAFATFKDDEDDVVAEETLTDAESEAVAQKGAAILASSSRLMDAWSWLGRNQHLRPEQIRGRRAWHRGLQQS